MNPSALLNQTNQTVGESQQRASDFSVLASSVLNGRFVAAPADVQYAPLFCSLAKRDFPLQIFKETRADEELAKSNWEINAVFASAIANASSLWPRNVSIVQSYSGDHFNNLINDLWIQANGRNGGDAIDRIYQIAKKYQENYGPIRFLEISNNENLTQNQIKQVVENFTSLKKLVWQARAGSQDPWVDVQARAGGSLIRSFGDFYEKMIIDGKIALACAFKHIQVIFKHKKLNIHSSLSTPCSVIIQPSFLPSSCTAGPLARERVIEQRFMRLAQTDSITLSDISTFITKLKDPNTRRDAAFWLNQLFRLPTFNCNMCNEYEGNLMGMFFKSKSLREMLLCPELLEIMINLVQRGDFEINALNSQRLTGLDLFDNFCEDNMKLIGSPAILGPSERAIASEIRRLLVSRGAKTTKELAEEAR